MVTSAQTPFSSTLVVERPLPPAIADAGPHRFVALDGLRGIAALAVVIYHCGTALKLPLLAGRAYLAVDFFFVLSGFVLAHAYGERLRLQALSPVGFYRIRFRRLWPLAFAGTALGVLLARPQQSGRIAAFAFGSVMLPDLLPGASAFPLNPPHWSIFLEMVANYVYAMVAPWLRGAALLAWVIASGAWLTFDTLHAGNANHIAPARVAFGFFVGIAIYEAWRKGIRPRRIGTTTLALLLVACLMVPTSRITGIADSATQLIAFPLIVWAGASATTKRVRLCRLSGSASYPLYALHYPILMTMMRT